MFKKLLKLSLKWHIIIDIVLTAWFITSAVPFFYSERLRSWIKFENITYLLALPYLVMLVHGLLIIGLCIYYLIIKDYKKFGLLLLYTFILVGMLTLGIFAMGIIMWGLMGY
jgi:hypothetical protein